METFDVLVMLIMLAIYAVIGIVALGSYIIKSMALYRLSKSRNIPNAFLAWIPVGCDWIVGKITEGIDEKRGINRKWSVVLLALLIVMIAFYVAVYVCMFIMMVVIMATGEGIADGAIGAAVIFLVLFYIGVFVAALVAMAYTICQYICIYKLYEDLVPEKALKYMLLHCIVPLAGPILLLKCSKLEQACAFEACCEEPVAEITNSEITE